MNNFNCNVMIQRIKRLALQSQEDFNMMITFCKVAHNVKQGRMNCYNGGESGDNHVLEESFLFDFRRSQLNFT